MTITLLPPQPSPIPETNPQPESEPQPQPQPQHEKQDEHRDCCVSPKPKLRLHAQALRHPGTQNFLTLVPDVVAVLSKALDDIITHLYTCPRPHSTDEKHQSLTFIPSIPPTRSVTVILRDFKGLAYTTGTQLDDDHKEIHLSVSWTRKCKKTRELVGVITHELVHCYQHTAPRPAGSCVRRPPAGLVEGIADFVRLKAGLAPAHWKRPHCAAQRPAKWDAGYQHTAYFLEWLEDVRVGKGAVGLLNDRLLRNGYRPYEGVPFWKSLFGATVVQLWDEYGRYLDGSGEKAKKSGDGSGKVKRALAERIRNMYV